MVLWYILTKRRIAAPVLNFISPWCSSYKYLQALRYQDGTWKRDSALSEETVGICLNCDTVYTGSYCKKRSVKAGTLLAYPLHNGFQLFWER